MRKLVVLLVLGASCASESRQKIAADSAREAFEGWIRGMVAGDADKTYSMLSDANRSQWLYGQLERNDPGTRRWRGELTGRARTELDLWWGVAKRHGNGRDETLPESVLRQPSLGTLFREVFLQDLPIVKAQMSGLRLLKVYGDDTGVTVMVKNGANAPEIYGMISQGGGWKIDTYRQADSPGSR